MHDNQQSVPFGHYVAIVAAYAACHAVLREFSVSYWILTSALRVVCLLLVPRKYWVALVVGDAISLLKTAIDCVALGWLWVATAWFPVILLCMPAVSALLKHMLLQDADGNLRVSTVLTVTAICAIVAAIRSDICVLIAYLSRPNGLSVWFSRLPTDMTAYLVGGYLGTLTLLPVVLALHESLNRRARVDWRPLIYDSFLLVVPYLAIVASTARTEIAAASTFAQLAIILPIISLTANHGKRGAAVGGMLSSIAMNCAFPYSVDFTTFRTEGTLALVITLALLATGPSRPIRTFSAYPEIRARIDRASFYFERGIGGILARIRQLSGYL